MRLKAVIFISGLFHFRNNNPEWEPTDLTVTLLICVRELPSSIYSKDDVILAWTLYRYFKFLLFICRKNFSIMPKQSSSQIFIYYSLPNIHIFENYVLQVYYAAIVGNFLPTLRNNQYVLFQCQTEEFLPTFTCQVCKFMEPWWDRQVDPKRRPQHGA